MSALNRYLDGKAVNGRGSCQQHYHIGHTVRVSLNNRSRKLCIMPATPRPFRKTYGVIVITNGNINGMRIYVPSRREVAVGIGEGEGSISFNFRNLIFMESESKTSLPRVLVERDVRRNGVAAIIIISVSTDGHLQSEFDIALETEIAESGGTLFAGGRYI